MERKKVNSGTIRSVGYDERNRLLEMEFSNGSIVQYAGVSAEVHRRLVNAPSIVSYFRDNIEESFTAKRVKG
jgi:YD repeat-containing protein